MRGICVCRGHSTRFCCFFLLLCLLVILPSRSFACLRCVCVCLWACVLKQARAALHDPFYDDQFDDADHGPPSPGRSQVSIASMSRVFFVCTISYGVGSTAT